MSSNTCAIPENQAAILANLARISKRLDSLENKVHERK
jgi:hypothetical protein